jgi:hypothetical protein
LQRAVRLSLEPLQCGPGLQNADATPIATSAGDGLRVLGPFKLLLLFKYFTVLFSPFDFHDNSHFSKSMLILVTYLLASINIWTIEWFHQKLLTQVIPPESQLMENSL